MSILIKQERIGEGGKKITIYKLRTMPEGENFEARLDGPIRNAGYNNYSFCGKFLRRFWIDELPQIINILKGEMGLVGLRPLLPKDFEKLPTEIQNELVKCKPGLIGALYAEPNSTSNLKDAIRVGREYLKKRKKHPFATDLTYLIKAYYNALLNKNSI